jgi:hypothetical protein
VIQTCDVSFSLADQLLKLMKVRERARELVTQLVELIQRQVGGLVLSAAEAVAVQLA